MIDKSNEYEAMYKVETDLWWYKILHEKTLDAIKKQFGNRPLRILDAGCGTGGMLAFLKKNGYDSLRGLDLSEDAVKFTTSRGFDVIRFDLRNISDYPKDIKFDVIICNDVLCYFDDKEIAHILEEFRKRINTNGLIISNNNAMKAFEGVHSIVLSIPRRFVIKEFQQICKGIEMSIIQHNYWSAFLAPLIWVYRKTQLVALKLGIININKLDSDVAYPGDVMNTFYYNVVKTEERVLPVAPFGSSLFMVLAP
jgi:SAM-dependent methyltransferase